MLTPQMIEQANKLVGAKVPITNAPKVTSRADEIRALAKTSPTKVTPNKEPGYVERVGGEYAKAGENIKEGIQKSSDDYASGVNESINATTLGGQFKGTLKATGGLLRGALRTVGNVAHAAFAPVTEAPIIKQGLEKVGEKVAEVPVVQTIAEKAKQLADRHPESAKDIGNLVDLFTLGVGKTVEKPLTEATTKVAEKTAQGTEKVVEKVGEKMAEKQLVKSTETALKSITPETKNLTPTEYEKLLQQKRITPKTKTSPSQYILSEEEKNTAIKYKDLLQNKDPVKNSTAIMDTIANKDAEVGKFLSENNGVFNNGELKNFISKKLEGISDVTVPESRVNKLKQTIITNFINDLPKNDMKSLWEARKAFDQKIEKAFSGSPSLQNEIKREFRNSIQDFIAERTPDTVYKDAMKEMRSLYKIHENVSDIATKQRGNSWIKQWIKDNPLKAKVLGWGAGYVGAKKLGILP